jgi:hypothetical protein
MPSALHITHPAPRVFREDVEISKALVIFRGHRSTSGDKADMHSDNSTDTTGLRMLFRS